MHPSSHGPLPRYRDAMEVIHVGFCLDWCLPGYGRQPTGPACGSFATWGHHAGEGVWHHRRVLRSCSRFSCPRCALARGGWASREAEAITRRLRDGCAALRRKVIHAVLSPAPTSDVGTLAAYLRLRGEAYSVGRKAGLRGGVLVFHHLRLGSKRFNHWKSLGCRIGPHFHFLGDGWVKADFERGGWVVKNLGVRVSVRGTAFYLLTHASRGILPNADLRLPNVGPRGPEVATWFGSMAYNRLHVALPAPSPVKCPTCGLEVPAEDWLRLVWEGSGPPPDTDFGVCESGEWSASARGGFYPGTMERILPI